MDDGFLGKLKQMSFEAKLLCFYCVLYVIVNVCVTIFFGKQATHITNLINSALEEEKVTIAFFMGRYFTSIFNIPIEMSIVLVVNMFSFAFASLITGIINGFVSMIEVFKHSNLIAWLVIYKCIVIIFDLLAILAFLE